MSLHSTTLVSDPRVGPPLEVVCEGRTYRIGKPPSWKQWAFIGRSELEQLYGGSKRGGKSAALAEKIISLLVSFPGNRGGLFRQDLTDLKDSTLMTFEQMVPRDLIIQHHHTDHFFLIKSYDPNYPSRLDYGGLGDAHTFESAKGKDYGFVAIDEPSEIDPQTYLMLLAQLCWQLPDGYGTFDPQSNCWRPPYQMLLGSNPEPGWLEDKFGHLIDAADRDHPIVTDGQRVYIMSLPSDNPYLPPNWEDILRNQKDIPQAWIDKYIEGKWGSSEGMVFKEFDRRVHCVDCPPDEYLKHLDLYASIDHGGTGTTCMVIVGIDPNSNIIVLDSYYEKNRLISQHADGMKRMMDQWVDKCGKRDRAKAAYTVDMGGGVYEACYGFEYILIDPSTEAKTMQNKNEMWSVQDMYRREGIPTQPAWNAIAAGITLLEEYIHVKPSHIHPFLLGPDGHQLRGAPSFFIVTKNNRDGIREMQGWKRTITVNKSIRYVGSDHWIDNVRYIAMSRPEPPTFTSSDIFSMSTHSQIAQRALTKFDDTFGRSGNSNSWFPHHGSSSGNTWFNRRRLN